MNTFWLKIAAAAIGIVVVVVLIGAFTGGDEKPVQPDEPERGFYDQVKTDKERFLTAPKPVEEQATPPKPDVPTDNKTNTEIGHKPVEPVKPEPKPVTLHFKELSEIDEIEAERLLNVTVPGRSMGRLQIGFKLMVDNCRRIMQRWPDSWYAYRASQMLADIPPRYQKRYGITEEEMDLSRFGKPRPGTRPFTDKDSR